MYAILHLFLVLITIQLVPCFGIDYSKASSLEEVLLLETEEIENFCIGRPEKAIDNLLSRAESFLLLGRYKEALNDYENAYSLFSLVKESEETVAFLLRALFGKVITCFNLGLEEEGWGFVNDLKSTIDFYKCEECSSGYSNFLNQRGESDIILIEDPHQSILGPEEISIRDCIERAGTTFLALKALLVKTRPEVQYILNQTIDFLYSQAIKCCKAGGLWKGCLQKLVNKLHKWNVFGIPADPAWD